MRDIKTARRELKFLKQILDEFVQDYECAQTEEDLSNQTHDQFLTRIGDVYWKYKDLSYRLDSMTHNMN